MATNIVFTKTLAAASANNIATAQAAVAGTPLTLNGSAVSGGVATIDTYSATNNTEPGRRVLITSTSGSETAVIAITGTNSNGQTVSESVTFSGSSTTLQSNLDYVTVTRIVPSGTIVGNLSAGTNGVGASRWATLNWMGNSPLNLGWLVELVSGSVNYTVQYTQDDPNNLQGGASYPLSRDTALGAQTATADSTVSTPVVAMRVLVNSGTGVIRARFVEAGLG